MSDASRVFSLSPGFAAQFDRDGEDYIYRRACRGRAIRVSAAERDAFVAAFNRALALQILALLAGLVAVIFLTIQFAFARGALTVVWVVAGTTAVTAIVILAFLAAWTAPARALADRTSVAPALTGAAARRAGWARTTWAQIAFAGFWGLFLASRGLAPSPTFPRWTWFSAAALMFFASATLAYLKWRLGRGPELTSPPE